MKKLFKGIGVLFGRRSVQIAGVFLIVFGGLWLWQRESLSRFENNYAKYLAVAGIQQNNAYTPGAATNPLRQTLNHILGEVLTKETSPSVRLQDAEQGLDLIAQMNLQVDAIGSSAPPVSTTIQALEAAQNDPGNVLRRGLIVSLVTAARAQMATIEDIRGLSYRADFQTKQIFQRIVSDNGALSDQYVTQLNAELPDIEKQFEARENLYVQLQGSVYGMQETYAALTGKS